MRVFVTGAAGFIGTAVVSELIAAGHEVLGLNRSPEKAGALIAVGAEVLQGSIEDGDVLREGVTRSDGVIHSAFNHHFSRFKADCEDDRRMVATLGSAPIGTNKPLIVASDTPMADTVPGCPAMGDNPVVGSDVHPRAASEEEVGRLAERGVNVSAARPPQVHDTRRRGLVGPLIGVWRERGACSPISSGWTSRRSEAPLIRPGGRGFPSRRVG